MVRHLLFGCSKSRVAPDHDNLLTNQHIDQTADGAIIPGRDAKKYLAERAHGIESQLARHLFWPYLLGVDAWDTSSAQRERSRAQRLLRFEELVQRSVYSVQKSDATVIDGDVPRTDRDLPRWKDEAALGPIRTLLMAHCAHEAATVRGYCQGMNDVAAVVLDAWLPTDHPKSPPSVATMSEAFWLFEGILDRTAADWGAGDEFAGVWRQTRCVAAIVSAASAKLGAHLRRIDETRGADLARDQPLACLFGCVLLRLKREMVSYEETRRLWEASWANHDSSRHGRHFHLVLLAALVLSQRKALLRLPATTSGFAEMHRLFMQLASTQRAAPLLDKARALKRGNRGVGDALDAYAKGLPQERAETAVGAAPATAWDA